MADTIPVQEQIRITIINNDEEERKRMPFKERSNSNNKIEDSQGGLQDNYFT